MNNLQANLYTMLKEIHEICIKNNIVYYLAGGTALGAIRNGGFLPWDDDIDIYITRNNWNRLVEVMKTELPENRGFVCVENCEEYGNPIARYVDKGTTSMMKSQLFCGKACGQPIEFLILDPIPRDEDGMWNHIKKMKIYAELLCPYFIINRNFLRSDNYFDLDMYNKYYSKSKKIGKENVLQELLDEITLTSDENCDEYCMRWGIDTLIYPKNGLGKPRLEKFEDNEFYVGEHAEYILRRAYGDSWMYVPSLDGQIKHVRGGDTSIPFERYTEIYMPLLNKKKLMESYNGNKEWGIKQRFAKENKEISFAKCKIKIASEHIKQGGYNLNKMWMMLENRNFSDLKNELSYFYETQRDPYVKKFNLIMDVDDNYLALAILYYIHIGKYYDAGKLVRSFEEKGEKPSGRLKEALDLFFNCRALSVAIYDIKDETVVSDLLYQNREYEDFLPDYNKAKLWLRKNEAKENKDFEILKSEAIEFIEKFGDDGELLSYLAYANYKLGNLSEAKNIYKKAIEKTRNGFIWREAKDLFGLVNSEMRELGYE